MLARHEILESLTIGAHSEIAQEVLEAAATEIWEKHEFPTLSSFEEFEEAWEIVAKHDAAHTKN